MKCMLPAPARFEQEIKGSRFLALATAARTPEEALDWLQGVHVADATHNCWAYRIGGLYRFNDDGEPGGSAGRPILAAIDGQNMDQTVCVVVRWYGGTKLGVGGLVRAYGGTAAECLRNAATVPIVHMERLALEVVFDHTGIARKILDDHSATNIEEDWTPEGVQFNFEIPVDRVLDARGELNEATRGQAIWISDV